MQVAITCRHGSISDDVRHHITEKSEKLLIYFERVTSIEVTIDIEKDGVSVEVLVDAEHKHNFVARDRGDSVPATFDQAMSKMEQQVRKYKEKLQDHRRDRPLSELVEGEEEEETIEEKAD